MMEKLIIIFVAVLMFELIVALAGLAFTALSFAIDELADKIKRWRGKDEL